MLLVLHTVGKRNGFTSRRSLAWTMVYAVVAISTTLMSTYTKPALAADLNGRAQALQISGDWNGLKKLCNDWIRAEP